MLLGDAWAATADACVAAGEASRKACQPVLDKAKPAILAAANAVDAWDSVSQQNWPCLAKSAIAFLQQLTVYAPNVVLPPILTDAMSLIGGYAGQYCTASTADAGAE